MFHSSSVSTVFSTSHRTSENTVSIMRRYENSAECKTPGAFALLLSLDVRFVTIFQEKQSILTDTIIVLRI
jgi:hypothetical protein